MNARLVGLGILACGSLLLATAASAAERGFYVGGFYGQTKIDLEEAFYADIAWQVYPLAAYTPTVQTGSSFDTKDSGYGFFGGYRLFDHFAIEGGYIDLGKFSYRDRSNGFDEIDEVDVSLEQTLTFSTGGIMLSGLGIWPLTYRSELFVRGGVIFSSSELTTHVISSNGFDDGTSLASESDTDFLVGIGGGMTFAEIYTLRLEYSRILDAGDEFIGEGDADMVSLGIVVAF
jgi:OOP family OmpA-OmpF porin